MKRAIVEDCETIVWGDCTMELMIKQRLRNRELWREVMGGDC